MNMYIYINVFMDVNVMLYMYICSRGGAPAPEPFQPPPHLAWPRRVCYATRVNIQFFKLLKCYICVYIYIYTYIYIYIYMCIYSNMYMY